MLVSLALSLFSWFFLLSLLSHYYFVDCLYYCYSHYFCVCLCVSQSHCFFIANIIVAVATLVTVTVSGTVIVLVTFIVSVIVSFTLTVIVCFIVTVSPAVIFSVNSMTLGVTLLQQLHSLIVCHNTIHFIITAPLYEAILL